MRWAKKRRSTGAFKAFRLVNPHSTMKLDVKGKDGKIVEWTFLGGSVQADLAARTQRGSERPQARR